MEAQLQAIHPIAVDDENLNGKTFTMEFRILRVYVDQSILTDSKDNHINPDKWKPLIMSFQKFYGLGDQVYPSALANIPEALYHSPDLDKVKKGKQQNLRKVSTNDYVCSVMVSCKNADRL
jgi:hypothetical protein